MKTINVSFKYGTSKGQDSYGYRIVSMYIDGKKVAMSVGVGFDQHGTCLGQWLSKNYQKEMSKLIANYGSGDDGTGFYGLVHYSPSNNRIKKATKDSKTYADGMCGWNSMVAIARKLKIDVK